MAPIDKHYENWFPSIYSDACVRMQKKTNVLQFRWIQSLPFLGSDRKHRPSQLDNFIFFFF